MRIAIDTHAIGSTLTGNERYIQNLAEQLLALDRSNEYFFFFSREEARRMWEGRAPNLTTYKVSKNPLLRLGVDFPRQLWRLRPHLFHYQYTGPLFRITPEIVTIHDVSFERHPEFFTASEGLRLRLTVRRAAKAARKIITVSEFSKAEIMSLLGVPEQKVKVIYNGVSPEFERAGDGGEMHTCLERYSIRKPYLLAVGNISRRKNQLMMMRAFALWVRRNAHTEHRLVIAGKRQDHGQDVSAEAARLGLDERRLNILGYVPEEDLPGLYAGADLLLNTSLYEGFGLPLIEAMRCGVPVIASHASCFPEIAGDAARLIDPLDPGEIAEAIEDLIGSKALRDDLISRGLRRAQDFRWDNAASQTLKVYYEASSEGAG
jgi:glycosyltransferase involved in cell wall biosynthesis